MIKVYVKGIFDLIHYGHIRFFQQAKNLGDFLTVGVSPDLRAASMKRVPIFSSSERAEVLRGLKFIDEVIEDGPKIISREFMEKNGFALYVFGTNNDKERAKRLKECKDLPNSMIIELPYTKGISTSLMIEKLQKTNFK